MNRANAYTILVGIALVVLPYLLTQSDVAVPPLAKVLLQAAILAVGVVARYLPADGQAQRVEITGTVPVTPVAAQPVLTDADAAADLAGTPRPDNPTLSHQPAQDVHIDGGQP